MARKRRRSEGGSLDSLLDTMTNVVGILIIVLVVVQLNLAEALKRIQSNLPEISQEELELTRIKLDQERKRMKTLEVTWTEMEPAEEKEEERLKEIALEIDDKSKVRDELLEDNDDIVELKKLLASRKTEVETADSRVLAADEELQKLKAILEARPKRDLPPPKIVNLPNPRPAPDNAEPRYVLMKHNKLYYVGDLYKHLFQVRDFIDENTERLAYRGTGMGALTYTVPTTKKNGNNFEPVRDREDRAFQKFRFDAKRVQDFFEKGQFGGADIAYRVTRTSPDNDYMTLRIVPKEAGGVDVEKFKARGSAFDNELKRVQVNRNYLMFVVAPDSFDAYLEARQMAEFYRIPAGWLPWPGEDFPANPSVKRESETYQLSDLPLETYVKLAAALGPVAEKNSEAAADKAANIKDPKVKPESDKWAKKFAGYASAVKNVPDVIGKIRDSETVTISPNPPSIPHVRVFKAEAAMPTKVAEPKPPEPDKPEPPKKPPVKKKDTID